MRKFFTMICLAALTMFAGCAYDDNDLWNKVSDLDGRITSLEEKIAAMNDEINSIKTLVDAIDSGYMISGVKESGDGTIITFSDGSAVTIKNGKQGDAGSDGNSPVIGVAKHTDGKYYWTVTEEGYTEWLKDADGNMVAVTGENGNNGDKGDDGSIPQMGVDDEGYWTVTVDGITSRVKDTGGNDVVAVGNNRDSFFSDIVIASDHVKVTLTGGESFVIPMMNFSISVDAETAEYFDYGQERSFTVVMNNVDEYIVSSKPAGWKALLTSELLTITAPAESNVYADAEGEVAITVVSNNYAGIVRFNVGLASTGTDDIPSAPVAATGFYVVNEDWFGHDNGTVNYFGWDGSVTYRAYREANGGASLGVTTQFATVYGDNAYIVSKQGNRFVVADAKTLESKLVLTDIGGDGRAFTGVTPAKGYISTLNGITVFDIENMRLGSAIAGISGQTGNMVCAGNYVFAVNQANGLYIIDTATDQVYDNIGGTYYSVTQSMDGTVWAAGATTLLAINPHTLAASTVTPADLGLGSTWGAWNAGSLCASMQENALYWINSGGWSLKTSLLKYDINTNTTTTIHTLGTNTAGTTQLKFYGAGMRIDPLTDKIVMVTNGGASKYYENYIHVLDNQGNLEKEYIMGDNGNWAKEALSGSMEGLYYWFPAVPVFMDENVPQILINSVVLDSNSSVAIDLNSKIVDVDNASATIHKSISDTDETLVQYTLSADSLIITSGGQTGVTTFTLTAVSNGKPVSKTIKVTIQ